jgi:hypothetical protein
LLGLLSRNRKLDGDQDLWSRRRAGGEKTYQNEDDQMEAHR